MGAGFRMQRIGGPRRLRAASRKRARTGRLALGLAVFSLTSLLACRGSTEAPSGQVLFLRYCASCHGRSGRGDGPLAATLQPRPADLTAIAKRAGKFDPAAVLAAIDGRRAVAAHGPREMPVWGIVFEEERKGEPYVQYAGLLQSQLLVQYLESLQQN
jgi:hypothetical protein